MDEKKKKEMLKELLVSEEDTLKKFEELIKKSKKLFGIDGKNGEIIFNKPQITNTEKIALLLIGKYFAREIGLINEKEFDINKLSKELGIKKTTLSAPLGQLVSNSLINYESGLYSAKHFNIVEILDGIINKYENSEVKLKSGLALKSVKHKKVVKNSDINGAEEDKKEKRSTIKKKGKKSRSFEIPDISFTSFPKGIEDLAADITVKKDSLSAIFDFEEDKINLLKKVHYNKDSQERFFNSLIYMTGYFYKFYEREIDRKKLKDALGEAKVSVTHKFERDMGNSKRRPFIFQKGNSFKITDSGIKLGLSIIKELIKE